MANFSFIAGQDPHLIEPRRFRRGLHRRRERLLRPPSKVFAVTADVKVHAPHLPPLRCPLTLGASLPPEKRLMLAVLDDALLTLAGHAHAFDRRGRTLTAEVDAWIAAEDIDWPFSFVNICHALHLDVSCVRSQLERWRRATPRSPLAHRLGTQASPQVRTQLDLRCGL